MDNSFELPPLPAPFGEFDVDGNTGKWVEARRGEHLFDADQMRAYALAAVQAERKRIAEGLKFEHLYDGDCPDEIAPDSRDPKCPACRVLMEFEK